ncbi:MAG TPA: acyltransferase domain-containing protein [Ktedonosporobacter sp.]|nr:acyltransferase domain-containing protein [Ktedonosporobacter sp.]
MRNSGLNKREPIAIIGMGCRFPGAANLAAFWNMLCESGDGITDFPSTQERFVAETYYDPQPATPGKMVAQQGGVLSEIDRFDSSFFDLAPREAAALDPQIRVLHEIAWETLEDAGEIPAAIAGSPTGVFIGATSNDYLDLHFHNLSQLTFYAFADNLRNMLSGRLSFTFDLRGPSLTIDTAFSSSLVAVHLACQSLWSGESTMALAGGVHLCLHPGSSVGFSQARMLSLKSRCQAFDADADGFVASEGAGLVLLKPLSQAQFSGNPIYAVICGSAVTNDGKSGPFLLTPSQAGQEITLRRAYQNAGKDPAHCDYVEAHAAGTQIGDPIEVAALSAVLGAGRAPEEHCYLGSVKTNIGHTESAAGIAGLIKTALCLKHRTLVPNLHFHTPHPSIPWQDLPLKVVEQVMPWPQTSRPALAGVSAFGLSGTNAHVVLEEARSLASPPLHQGEAVDQAHLLLLSAKSPSALAALAQAWNRWLMQADDSSPCLPDICSTAALRRTHHEYRLAVVGATHTALARQLEVCSRTLFGPMVPRERCSSSGGRKIVLVFPGQGAQWIGMGRRLLEQEAVFRSALEHCEQAMQPYTDWSLLEQMMADEQQSRLQEISCVQPMLFAIQVALARLWLSLGLEPHAVIGHSMGEIAAAHIAGVLSLQDAARIICLRSRLLQRVSGQGSMVVVGLSLEQACQAIQGKEGSLSLAVSNSPTSTVLSGDTQVLNGLIAQLKRQDIFCRPVKVDVASHSPCVDPLLEDLRTCLAGIKPQPASIPLHSTVTTSILKGPECDPTYWARNLREPVLFAPVVQQLLADGPSTFLEISPHPLLSGAIQQCAQLEACETQILSSMRRNEDECSVLLSTAGALFTTGFSLHWQDLFPPGACVPLPSYPWQRERCWSAPVWQLSERGEQQSKSVAPLADDPEATGAMPSASPGSADNYLPASPEKTEPGDQTPHHQLLQEKDHAKRETLMENYLLSRLVTVLGSSQMAIDPRTSLDRLGLDSLMFLEVRKAVTRDLNIELSLEEFLQKRTVRQMAQRLCASF